MQSSRHNETSFCCYSSFFFFGLCVWQWRSIRLSADVVRKGRECEELANTNPQLAKKGGKQANKAWWPNTNHFSRFASLSGGGRGLRLFSLCLAFLLLFAVTVAELLKPHLRVQAVLHEQFIVRALFR